MRQKSSAHGKESVKALPRLQSVPLSTGEVSIVRLESTVEQTPMQTWLRIQAQSLMGYTPTLDEAELLWQFVDINTREPHVVLPRRGLAARLSHVLSVVGGMIKGQRSNSHKRN